MSSSYKNEKNIWMGFDIHTTDGACPRPQQIHYWKEHHFKSTKPEAPFHYKADALVGLSLIHLNKHLQNPFSSPQMNYPSVHQYWLGLEPHFELYQRSHNRVQSLVKNHVEKTINPAVTQFEKNWTEILDNSTHNWGMDLHNLCDMIDAIDFFEAKYKQPLIYNFNIAFSKDFVTKMHYVYSMLFHLRTLIAMDYNAFIHDPTHESIKVDSITDYLSRADFVANDASLYWKFKKQKDKMPEAVFQNMDEHFHHFAHNACHLVENLPKSFMNSLPTDHLEDTLYLAQMDWLLGSDAGLLFRIREELYGIRDGYEKIFWPELEGGKILPKQKLSINCLLTEQEVYPETDAA